MPYLIGPLIISLMSFSHILFHRFKISFPELSEVSHPAFFVPLELPCASAHVWCFELHTEIHSHSSPLERYLNLCKVVCEGRCGWILVSKGENGTNVSNTTELCKSW